MVSAFVAFVCFVFGCDTSFRLHQPIHLVLNASAKLHVLPHLISKQHLDPSFSVIVHKIAHCTWLADSLGLPRSASVLQVPTLPLRLQLCFNQACLISHASSSHSSQSCMQHSSHPLSHPTTTSTAASCYYALNLVKVLFLA